jgi:uncharacterized protein (TIGR02246 family)
MHTSADSKTVLQHYVAAVQAGDAETIRDCFAPDAVWQLDGELPISGTWRGREAITTEFLASAMSYYQPGSVSLQITSIIAEGQKVAMEWTSRARNRRGEPYENHCIGVFSVRDGKIAHVHEYMDTLYAYRSAFSAAQAA